MIAKGWLATIGVRARVKSGRFCASAHCLLAGSLTRGFASRLDAPFLSQIDRPILALTLALALTFASAAPVAASILQVQWRMAAAPDQRQFRPREPAEPLASADGSMVWLTSGAGLVAVSTRQGHEIWRQTTTEPMVGRAVLADLPAEGTAAAWGPTLYAATLGGRLYALNPLTGAPRWPAPMQLEVAVHSGLAADKRYVYASADPAMLLAIDRGSGKPVWRWSTLVDRDYVIEGQGSPAVVGNSVYFGTPTGRLVALSARDGALLWEATLELRDKSPYGDVDSTPVFITTTQGPAVVATSHSGGICAVAVEDGRLLWRYAAEGLGQPVVTPDGIVAVSALGEIHLVDKLGRRKLARKLTDPVVGVAVALTGGLILVPSERGLDVVRLSDLRVLERLANEAGFGAAPVLVHGTVVALANNGMAFGLSFALEGGAAADLR